MGQRRTSRDERIVPVRLWGMDVSGQPFIEAVWTRNVSTDGALLKGIRRKLQAGDIVGITYAQKKARLRVVWIGQAGSAEEGHVGLQTLPGGETLRMVWESILALRPNVRFCSGSKSAKRQRRWHSGRELQRFAFTKAVLRIDLPRSATPLLWSIFSTVATTAGFLRT